MQTVHAHFDGSHVLLDDPIALKINDRLLVTVLEESVASDTEIEYAAAQDTTQNDFLTKEELSHYLALEQ